MLQVCFHFNLYRYSTASEAGQLQLNVFEPLIIYNLLQSMVGTAHPWL
jgi:aspartate ammonia-lyase